MKRLALSPEEILATDEPHHEPRQALITYFYVYRYGSPNSLPPVVVGRIGAITDWKGRLRIGYDSYGSMVASTYGPMIDAVARDIFGDILSVEDSLAGFRKVRSAFYGRLHPVGPPSTGIVIAGFGESEAFPVLVHHEVWNVAAGRLKALRHPAQ